MKIRVNSIFYPAIVKPKKEEHKKLKTPFLRMLKLQSKDQVFYSAHRTNNHSFHLEKVKIFRHHFITFFALRGTIISLDFIT